MDNSFSTIDEYIAQFDGLHRIRLDELRQTIINASPSEAKETINYGMPTLRYNGNLIHFAAFKNHLGVYPGAEAIEHFQKDLTKYKTSKGAIQIPLDDPIPVKLITQLLHFNVNKLKDKEGPKWDSHKLKWTECDEFMNQLILKTKTPLKKEFKWGSDIYTYQKKNVIGWAGFKDFFSLWFYNGVFLEDKDKVLINASEGKTKSLRQWRFKDVKEMDEKKIMAYIEESVQTIKDGKEIKPERNNEVKIEGIIKDELDRNKEFNSAFLNLTPGKQREYLAYIHEAKQDKTRNVRLEKIIPMVLNGKGLNDKYKG